MGFWFLVSGFWFTSAVVARSVIAPHAYAGAQRRLTEVRRPLGAAGPTCHNQAPKAKRRVEPETRNLEPRLAQRPTGFSLVEVIVSMLIVGGLFVAAMNTLGASRTSQLHTSDREQAHMLAQGLMTEILAQAYEEPVDPPLFGLEADETLLHLGTRWLFDDVDDYHGWSSSPEQPDGTAIAGTTGWTRQVEVAFVEPTDLASPVSHDTGLKRIVVTVRRGSVPVAQLTALRSRHQPGLDQRLGASAP